MSMGYEEELPSDADLINYVETNIAEVTRYHTEDSGYYWIVTVNRMGPGPFGVTVSRGSTWRAAVENAIKNHRSI